MKKIIPILFLFFICLFCYYIYNITEDDNPNITMIGDNIASNPYIIKNNQTDTSFINQDYHIKDLLDTIKYNEEITINNKSISIHLKLKQADILIISIGMNDIYYKLNENSKDIYTYMNNIINIYSEILEEISKYDYKKVYVLGYYNIYDKYNDIFVYTNYKLKKITSKYNYTFIDLNNLFHNKTNYLINNTNFSLNNNGYYQIFKFIVEKSKKS